MSNESKDEVSQFVRELIEERREDRDKLITRGNWKIILAVCFTAGAQVLALRDWKSGVDRRLSASLPVVAQAEWVARTEAMNTNGWRGANVRAVVREIADMP